MSHLNKIGITLFCAILFLSASVIKKGYDPGDFASDFKLKNVDGKIVSLSDYKSAKGFIIIFDCNSCPYSKAYNSRINALNNKYLPVGFPVIAINANDPNISNDDSFDEMVKQAREKKYTFPYLVDISQEVAKAYGATNTPHTYVLSKSGETLKVEYVGAIDDNARDASSAKNRYVENAVDALLEGKAVTLKKTKALGCGIKWKNS